MATSTVPTRGSRQPIAVIARLSKAIAPGRRVVAVGAAEPVAAAAPPDAAGAELDRRLETGHRQLAADRDGRPGRSLERRGRRARGARRRRHGGRAYVAATRPATRRRRGTDQEPVDAHVGRLTAPRAAQVPATRPAAGRRPPGHPRRPGRSPRCRARRRACSAPAGHGSRTSGRSPRSEPPRRLPQRDQLRVLDPPAARELLDDQLRVEEHRDLPGAELRGQGERPDDGRVLGDVVRLDAEELRDRRVGHGSRVAGVGPAQVDQDRPGRRRARGCRGRPRRSGRRQAGQAGAPAASRCRRSRRSVRRRRRGRSGRSAPAAAPARASSRAPRSLRQTLWIGS